MRKGCLGVGFVYPDHDVVRVRLEVRRSNMRNRGGGGEEEEEEEGDVKG
jgi:hypothetical protein